MYALNGTENIFVGETLNIGIIALSWYLNDFLISNTVTTLSTIGFGFGFLTSSSKQPDNMIDIAKVTGTTL